MSNYDAAFRQAVNKPLTPSVCSDVMLGTSEYISSCAKRNSVPFVYLLGLCSDKPKGPVIG